MMHLMKKVFGKKQMKVKLEPRNKVDPLEGKAWVKDGRVYTNPSPTVHPIITASRGVRLYKNNKLIINSTTATRQDVFELVTEVEKKETYWDISIDERKLKVILTVEPGYGKKWMIKDVAPDYQIMLRAEEEINVVNHLKYEDIIAKLSDLRVKQGFYHVQIMKAIEATKPGKFEIATGVMPKEGKDGWLELLTERDQDQKDGNVHDIVSTPSVHTGQAFAKIHPPIPGIPGITVTNEPAPPKQTSPLIVKTGKGTVVHDGMTMIATEPGRPFITQTANTVKVSILPKYTHKDNVNSTSGNLRIMGDIDLLGSVAEGMSVEAIGEIFILGNTNMSTIKTNGTIKIAKKVIGSTLSAGKGNMIDEVTRDILVCIKMDVDRMISSIEQLIQSPAFQMRDLPKRGLEPLIRLLIIQKFQTLPISIKKYHEMLNEWEDLLDKKWLDLGEEMYRYFLTSIPNKVVTLPELLALSKRIEEQSRQSDELNVLHSTITALYAINSTMYCRGDVNIFGKGCYNSKIYADGKITVNGILRGGEVYGGLGVHANEAGSELGVATKISVPRNQTVTINKAREGTEIIIGTVKHVIQTEEHNINVYLDQHEKIVINHF